MKASKGFLLVELAVVFLVVGTLLLCVTTSFGRSAQTLNFVQSVRQAQALAEQSLLGVAVDLPDGWQVHMEERNLQGITLREVQIIEAKSGKIIFNLLLVW